MMFLGINLKYMDDVRNVPNKKSLETSFFYFFGSVKGYCCFFALLIGAEGARLLREQWDR